MITAGKAETSDDLSGYFTTDDFGKIATLNKTGARVAGHFDNDQETRELGEVEAVIAVPVFTCPTSELGALIEGDSLVIEGIKYTVTNRMDQGDGISMLRMAT